MIKTTTCSIRRMLRARSAGVQLERTIEYRCVQLYTVTLQHCTTVQLYNYCTVYRLCNRDVHIWIRMIESGDAGQYGGWRQLVEAAHRDHIGTREHIGSTSGAHREHIGITSGTHRHPGAHREHIGNTSGAPREHTLLIAYLYIVSGNFSVLRWSPSTPSIFWGCGL